MPSPNLDLVRSIYATWKRNDFGSATWAHPDIEVVAIDGPQPGSWRGLDGLAEALGQWREAWVDFHAEAEEFCALPGDRVLVLIRRSGRGKTSGLELGDLRTKGAAVFDVRDGKVTRVVNYFDRQRALTDLGPTPQADSAGS